MRICAFRSLRPHIPWGLLLSLFLLLTSPSTVQAAAENQTNAPDCSRTGFASQPVAVQLTRSAALVQATLHSAPSSLPAAGCMVSLQFQVSEDARPPQAVWRDVEGRAVRFDGTPDPARPVPLLLRLWIRPRRESGIRGAGCRGRMRRTRPSTWRWPGAQPAAANDLAVLDILSTALGLDLDILKPIPEVEEELWAFKEELGELGARLNDSGRVTELDWHANHPYETYEDWTGGVVMTFPMSGIHPPGVQVAWELPSELGQLTALSRLALGGPLLTGAIPPELGQLTNLEELTLAGSRLTGSVPPELRQLTKLRTLELHDNRLTTLPPELGQLTRLAYLSLSGNQLTSLPPELGRLTQLYQLGLAGNQLNFVASGTRTVDQIGQVGCGRQPADGPAT